MLINKKKIEHQKIQNFTLKVKNKYYKINNKLKKEWFTENIPDNCYEYLKKLDPTKEKKITIKFNHIDDDNPEFFLQPNQIIKIIEGQIIINRINNEINPILLIEKFVHIDEEERNKFKKNNK